MVKTVDFVLRYTHCWEDIGFVLRQLPKSTNKKILSVCSGGDNAISLLTTYPEKLVVADINPYQLYLLEIKMAAIQHLTYKDCLGFLGFYPAENRFKTYEDLASYLSPKARIYWDAERNRIESGLITSGRLERNLRFFARYYRPLLHRKKNVDLLLKPKNHEAQKTVYQSTWDTRKWRFLFRVFFSNTSLKFIAPDPDFFNYVSENVGKYLLNKTAQHFSHPACQNNPFLHYALKGHFRDCLPHTWREENFDIIRSQLHKISLFQGFVEEACIGEDKFDILNLSNIFEYTTKEEFKAIGEKLHHCTSKDALLFYWNILLPRKLSADLPSLFQSISDTGEIPDPEDHGWIYYRAITENALKP
ncbi:MAG: DUF3419 family protein [Cryomorphaceae bacterium]|nr:DUF3419 family protein [Cryomorphaceae bacterium]